MVSAMAAPLFTGDGVQQTIQIPGNNHPAEEGKFHIYTLQNTPVETE
jgi:hypothetical protein